MTGTWSSPRSATSATCPRSAADVPKDKKGEPWARLGVDVENDFKPLYIVSPEKKDQVRHLKALLKDADEVYLATDEDREGEAISWHLLEVLKPKVPVQRMVFHEITREAIQHALENPREIDRRLVDAQETRRILDRLYGYEVSPVLWRKIAPASRPAACRAWPSGWSCERERERMAFRSAGYWDLARRRFRHADAAEADRVPGHARGSSAAPASPPARTSATTAASVHGRRGASSCSTSRAPAALAAGLGGAAVRRALGGGEALHAASPPRRSRPPRCSRRRAASCASARRDHAVAQRLYENGYITYMRTDSTTLSERRSTPRGPRSASCSARSTCPTRPASTAARSRTPRRPTRPSARPATASAPPTRSRSELRPTSSGSTS